MKQDNFLLVLIKGAAGLLSFSLRAVRWLRGFKTGASAKNNCGLVAVSLSGQRLPNRQVFMEVFHGAVLREIRRCVPITSQDPLGGEQPLQAHRSSGMNTRCAYTNLCSWRQSQGKKVRENGKQHMEAVERRKQGERGNTRQTTGGSNHHTQSEAVAISEAWAGVPENTGAVELMQELLCCFLWRRETAHWCNQLINLLSIILQPFRHQHEVWDNDNYLMWLCHEPELKQWVSELNNKKN